MSGVAVAAFLLAGVSGTIWHSLMTQRHLPTAFHLVSHNRSCENLLVSWLPNGKEQTLVSPVCAWTPNLMPWWPGWIDIVGFERPPFSLFLKYPIWRLCALLCLFRAHQSMLSPSDVFEEDGTCALPNPISPGVTPPFVREDKGQDRDEETIHTDRCIYVSEAMHFTWSSLTL